LETEDLRPRLNMSRRALRILVAAVAAISVASSAAAQPQTPERRRAEILQAYGGAYPGPINAYVSRVGERMAVAAGQGGRCSFSVINSEVVNAFASPPGCDIYVTRGLLDLIRSEDELAAVLGHEVGHVVNRHAAEHMAKGQLGQMVAMAVGVAGSDDQGRGQRAAMAAAMVNQMLQLKFSRSDELEADRVGMDYMKQAGYNPEAMLGVMHILADASRGGRQPELLSTHPYPEDRIAANEKYLGR